MFALRSDLECKCYEYKLDWGIMIKKAYTQMIQCTWLLKEVTGTSNEVFDIWSVDSKFFDHYF